MLAQRLRSSGRVVFRAVSPRSGSGGVEGSTVSRVLALSTLKRKASNSWSAVQDTYLSTKEVFERHRVVFTVGTSIASVLTAWAGYSLRQHHHLKLEKRLESIEESIKGNSNVEHEEIKKIVGSGNVSTAACFATAWTSLILGYALGWRGGLWYAKKKFQREQLKLMGQMKPQKWQFLRKPLLRFRNARNGRKNTEVSSTADQTSLAFQSPKT